MKKILTLFTITASILIALAVGWYLAQTLNPSNVKVSNQVETNHKLPQSTGTTTETTSDTQSDSSTVISENSDTSNSGDWRDVSADQPTAQTPEWYDPAEEMIASYQDMVDLGQARNSTFPLDTASESMVQAIEYMAQYPANDGESIAQNLRMMLTEKGYPTDKTELIEQLITMAFHSAGWQTAPNEEGYVNPE